VKEEPAPLKLTPKALEETGETAEMTEYEKVMAQIEQERQMLDNEFMHGTNSTQHTNSTGRFPTFAAQQE